MRLPSRYRLLDAVRYVAEGPGSGFVARGIGVAGGKGPGRVHSQVLGKGSVEMHLKDVVDIKGLGPEFDPVDRIEVRRARLGAVS